MSTASRHVPDRCCNIVVLGSLLAASEGGAWAWTSASGLRGVGGERSVSFDDELERSIAAVRARFAIGTVQIASGLSWLERHSGQSPLAGGSPLQVAARQIATIQEQLSAQLDRMPAAPRERFKRMASLVETQQSALQGLTLLLKEHTRMRQHQAAPRTTVGQIPISPVAPIGADPNRADPFGWLPPDELPELDEPAPVRRQARRGHGRDERVGVRGLLSLARRPVEAITRAAPSRVLLLINLTIAGSFVAFAMLPRESSQEAGAETPAAVRTARELPSAPPVIIAPRVIEEPPSRAAPAPASTTEPDPQPIFAGQPQTSSPAFAAEHSVAPPRADAASPAADRGVTPAPPVASRVSAADARATGDDTGRNEQYVPVVFTHKDDRTAKRAFGELQRQYPVLLTRRQAEIQPIDLGSKGIWHRVVVLPAATRQDAARLCDELTAAGYDRCWVKPY